MSAGPIDQTGWTQRFVESSERSASAFGIEKLRKSWWFNPLNTHSMRLSREGVNYATMHAKIQYYTHNLNHKILPKTLLQLEKIIEYPYFIVKLDVIMVFDQSTSITLTLYNNDLQTYLDNVQKFS